MPCILNQYDRISTYTLELLQNFSKQIIIIENIINELLKDDSLNKNMEIDKFKKIAMEIMNATKLYNLLLHLL
ncbi:hypothetical protein N494_13665 [Clostridium botulinum A2B7 92]|uniref:Uncharacterized protein n=1 Tax=Clostridium botulinum TaxID=1491 RepID=A0A846J343_CLOBO|nr:hypothetical protein [Clostridium botulinum]KEI97300.1 hypothetical protein N494_13665 [Clostridium botulinum A2B7 92]NFH66398.1 hypothetical protein [Clostridium botulinum]NFJ07721.1 hypothetical protein [Clostridium botulinum]NFK13489.1 hypothetical protein [Clostridium botulinum]NFM93383.1 hypothetical protein [Clostridium botulinum]